MKYFILFVILFLGFCSFAQNPRVVFSIEKAELQSNIVERVEKYFSARSAKYEIVYICYEQKLFVIDILNPYLDEVLMLKALNTRFDDVYFIYRKIDYMTDNCCKSEYLIIKNKKKI